MKVCILGDGLTSLSLAKAMVNKDIYVDIIRDKKHKEASQTRTLGISKSNIKYFNQNIMNINKLLWEIKKIKIFSESKKNHEIINFQDNNPNLFCMIKNNELFNHINSDLNRSPFFSFKKNLSLRELKLKNYDLIINCDFSHEISKKFFSKKITKNYYSFAYTTILKHEKLISNNTAVQIFTDKGPIAFLPVSKDLTSVVYSFTGKNLHTKSEIISLIEKFNPQYKIEKVYEISKFNLNSSILRKYYKDNILAFGDLLHKIHPLAGQGFNMSLRDISDLMKIIDHKIELGLSLDKEVCKEFQTKTKSKNYIFSSGVDFIYECFKFENMFQSNIISSTVELIGKNKFLNTYFKKIADTGFRI